MNNIDILEDFLDYYSYLKTAIGGDDIREFEIRISKNELKAISNLIAENKELKERNKTMLSDEQSKEIEELKKRERKAYIKGTNDADELCNKKWVDKIKAIIEEVKDGTYDAKIVLQSLLGEE